MKFSWWWPWRSLEIYKFFSLSTYILFPSSYKVGNTFQHIQWNIHIRAVHGPVESNTKSRNVVNGGNITLRLLILDHWNRMLNEGNLKSWGIKQRFHSICYHRTLNCLTRVALNRGSTVFAIIRPWIVSHMCSIKQRFHSICYHQTLNCLTHV
jgi:hypothetical protein